MIKLKVSKRTLLGKKTKRLRRQGIVPGAIARYKKPTIPVQIEEKELLPLVRLNQVEKIQVEVEGQKEPIEAVVTEIVVNPLNNKIESFLLTEVTPKSHVIVHVPIRTKGESPAVRNNIGVLVFSSHYVRLVVNSENIVPYIEVDISGLDQVGQRILIGDLELPEGVKLASAKDAQLTVLTIRPPQKTLAEEKAEEEEAAAEVEELEEGEAAEATVEGEAAEGAEKAEEGAEGSAQEG